MSEKEDGKEICKQLAILRNPRKKNFTVIGNEALRDKRLSLKARGLLTTMMSLPDSWEFSENGLDKIFEKDGITSIKSGLKELESCGYLERSRSRDSLGMMRNAVWTITDCPTLDNPTLDNPTLDNPTLENHTQLNKDTSNKDLSRTHELKNDSKPTRHQYGEYSNVLLTDDDLEKLKSEFPSDWSERIDRLSSYMESTGKHYKNHLATIRNWARNDKGKEKVDEQRKAGLGTSGLGKIGTWL